MKHHDEDEFFGNQDECEDKTGNDETTLPSHDADGLAQRERRATNEQFRNMGYLQAHDESKEVRLQEGFEAGYNHYFDKAMRLGELIGEATSPLNDELSTEKRELVNQVVRSIRVFLTNIPTDDSDDLDISKESLESLTVQLSELIVSNKS